MGEVLEQMRADIIARRNRLGLGVRQPIVDRALVGIVPPSPDRARALLADEFIRNWPVMPTPVPTPVQWFCHLPRGLRQAPANRYAPDMLDDPVKPSMADIISVVCDEFEITAAEIKGQSRISRIILPRQVAMYLGVKFGYSLPKIGRHLGDRDHTTARNGRLKIGALVRLDPEFAATMTRLSAKITAMMVARAENMVAHVSL